MDQVMLITGASRGFGRAAAEALAAPGRHLVLLARTVGGLEEAADAVAEAGGAATLVPLDLTDTAGLARLGAALGERWGGLDLLIHAAAHAPLRAPAGHLEPKEVATTLAVNAGALAALIGATEPLLRARGGRAVILDDPAAGAGWATYAASKAAARALAEAWAEEGRRLRPEVLLHTPPPMATALRARFYPGEDRAALTDPRDAARALLDRLGL